MSRYVRLLFFLFCCGGMPVFAQMENQLIDGNDAYANPGAREKGEKEMFSDTIRKKTVGIVVKDSANVTGSIIVGDNNTHIFITNKISTNKKELNRLEEEFGRSKTKLDSTLLEIENIKVLLHEKMVQKDSAYQALKNENEKLERMHQALGATCEYQKKKMAELKAVIQRQEKGKFLPFGIKQFQNERKVLGCTFLASEIAVPVALEIGLECAAGRYYDRYKNQKAQTLTDHRDYYKKYRNYHRAAVWAPVAAGVLVYGANILCNYYGPVKGVKVVLHPAVEVDNRGKVMCGVGMSFNF